LVSGLGAVNRNKLQGKIERHSSIFWLAGFLAGIAMNSQKKYATILMVSGGDEVLRIISVRRRKYSN
jgi:hypothetical protein